MPTVAARPSGRSADQLRAVELVVDVNRYAEGSCLAKFGNTHVLCTATLEEKAPSFLKGSGKGQAVGPHPGDPAPDRSELARGHGHDRVRRTPDPPRLRRDPGRWRHA